MNDDYDGQLPNFVNDNGEDLTVSSQPTPDKLAGLERGLYAFLLGRQDISVSNQAVPVLAQYMAAALQEQDIQSRLDELDYVAEVLNDQNDATAGVVTGQFIENRTAELQAKQQKGQQHVNRSNT
jgi:hypothetical protein